MNAIVLRNVTKKFKKRTIRRDHSTFKSELVRLFLGRGGKKDKPQTVDALKGINLTIQQGKTVGIIGRNGSGKSSLLKLMTGIYRPTSGSIEVNGRISALLDLGAGFHPEFSGRENILINGRILGMSAKEIHARMDDIIAFSELGEFVDEPVRTYSSGMYMRLAFSVATNVNPDILIIDEILAVGDEHFSKKSLAKMLEFKNSGKTIVLVTHDLSSVARWCDEAAWIDGGYVRLHGEPKHVIKEYLAAVAEAERLVGGQNESLVLGAGQGLPESVSPSLQAVSRAIEAIALRAHATGSASTVDVEDGVDVRIHLNNHVQGEDRVRVSLVREDGFVLFESVSDIDGSAVAAATTEAPAAEVVLSIVRIGAAAGQYTVKVAVVAKTGEAREEMQRPLQVTANAPVAGVYKPPCQWTLESPTQIDELPRRAASAN